MLRLLRDRLHRLVVQSALLLQRLLLLLRLQLLLLMLMLTIARGALIRRKRDLWHSLGNGEPQPVSLFVMRG